MRFTSYYLISNVSMFGKVIASVLFIAIFTTLGSAQFAVTYKFNSSSYPTWEEISISSVGEQGIAWEKLPDLGHEVGLSYWFRLKKRRLEFYPEVFASIQKSKGDFILIDTDQVPTLSRTSYGVQMNIQAYPLDFLGDCDCPTFSKDGNFIKKGFFWGLNPGFVIHKLSATQSEGTQDVTSSSFRIGGFIGIDIGVNTLITISPLLNLNYSPSVQWDDIENILNGTKPILHEETNIWELQPGVKVSFRPDYRKEQRRWR